MNIWLCNISGGILGYAQFPQSPLGGMGCNAQAAATDGVVFLYNSIGKSAITGFTGPYNEGRTATHEIGHWLGLRHIWGDGGCTVDDYCNDTPEAGAPNYGCPAGTNSCGTSALNNVAVTVLPSATVPGSITGPISVCENVSGIVYTVPVVTGAISYNWTAPVGGTIVSGQGTNSAVIDFGTTTGAVQVTQTDACGTSLPSILSVIVNAIPSLPAVSVVDSCCTSDLTAIGTSLLWSTTETTPVITVTTAGIYTVTQTVNGCTSLAASISAAPFNAPSVTFASLNDVCINAPIVTLTGGIPAGGTYSGIAVTAGQFDPFTAGFGTFAINYNYTDENGCSGNATQNISVGCAGLDETSGNVLSIYPNPTSGQFTILSSLELISEINVYDEMGRLIQVISKNENQVNVDLSLCAEGVYSLEIETATGKFRERIILNK